MDRIVIAGLAFVGAILVATTSSSAIQNEPGHDVPSQTGLAERPAENGGDTGLALGALKRAIEEDGRVEVEGSLHGADGRMSVSKLILQTEYTGVSVDAKNCTISGYITDVLLGSGLAPIVHRGDFNFALKDVKEVHLTSYSGFKAPAGQTFTFTPEDLKSVRIALSGDSATTFQGGYPKAVKLAEALASAVAACGGPKDLYLPPR